VDAPCSGEGMLRKDENARLNWSEENVKACAIRQKAILETANKLLKRNGYLLYSTCTFSLEEDEQVVAEFCALHNYEIIPLSYSGAINGVKIGEYDTHHTLRFYPHKFQGEGQFVALLRKKESCNTSIAGKIYLKPLSKFPTEYKLFKTFCEDNLTEYNDILDNVVYNNNTIYYVANKQLAESGINLVNCGVVVGEIIKSRFEPNHNLVSCFGTRFKQFIEVDEQKAYTYLKGETLTCDLNGYVVVGYNGVTLGLGKSSNGIMKNHYPKGLRNI
jgi:NOL1/NOP2/fmu family ribosome biogenesis protein